MLISNIFALNHISDSLIWGITGYILNLYHPIQSIKAAKGNICLSIRTFSTMSYSHMFQYLQSDQHRHIFLKRQALVNIGYLTWQFISRYYISHSVDRAESLIFTIQTHLQKHILKDLNCTLGPCRCDAMLQFNQMLLAVRLKSDLYRLYSHLKIPQNQLNKTCISLFDCLLHFNLFFLFF